MQIGDYSLGQQVTGDRNLAEISKVEYLALGRMFLNERIFSAGQVDFLGRRWKLFIGTIAGRVYKLSMQFVSRQRDVAAAAFAESNIWYSREFGQPSENPDGLLLTWDSPFGNVVLHHGSAVGQHVVSIHATSGEVVHSASPLNGTLAAAGRYDSAAGLSGSDGQLGRKIVRLFVKGAVGYTLWMLLSWPVAALFGFPSRFYGDPTPAMWAVDIFTLGVTVALLGRFKWPDWPRLRRPR
jgi:hypothetical protein